MKMEITMKEMKTIYQVGGKLCKNFIGQISYTVCLDQTYEELDIEFSFGPQHFRPEDVTPELKQRLLDYCKKKSTGSKNQHRRNGKMLSITV